MIYWRKITAKTYGCRRSGWRWCRGRYSAAPGVPCDRASCRSADDVTNSTALRRVSVRDVGNLPASVALDARYRGKTSHDVRDSGATTASSARRRRGAADACHSSTLRQRGTDRYAVGGNCECRYVGRGERAGVCRSTRTLRRASISAAAAGSCSCWSFSFVTHHPNGMKF